MNPIKPPKKIAPLNPSRSNLAKSLSINQGNLYSSNNSLGISLPVNKNISPANPAAVSTVRPSMNTQVQNNPSLTTPAAQQFIQNQVSNINPNISNNPAYQTGGNPNAAPSLVGQTVKEGNSSSPDQAYLKYVTGMTEQVPDAKSKYLDSIKKIRDEEAKAAMKLAEIQSKYESRGTGARREYESILDQPGMLRSGASQAASVADRRNESKLADIALQESAAARTLLALQGRTQLASKPVQLGKDFYDPMTGEKLYSEPGTDEGFTLGEGQVRYDAQGNVIARGTPKSGSSAEAGAPNPAVDAWVNQIQNGTAKITSVPSSLRNAVIQAIDSSAGGESKAVALTQQALEAIKTLESTEGRGGAIGAGFQKVLGALPGVPSGPFPGTDAAGYIAQLDRVKALLTLPNLQYLKGLGAMSDREFSTISSSVAALNPSMTESQFNAELKRIKETLENTLRNTDSLYGQETKEKSEEDQLRELGYSEEQIKVLKSK